MGAHGITSKVYNVSNMISITCYEDALYSGTFIVDPLLRIPQSIRDMTFYTDHEKIANLNLNSYGGVDSTVVITDIPKESTVQPVPKVKVIVESVGNIVLDLVSP